MAFLHRFYCYQKCKIFLTREYLCTLVGTCLDIVDVTRHIFLIYKQPVLMGLLRLDIDKTLGLLLLGFVSKSLYVEQ